MDMSPETLGSRHSDGFKFFSGGLDQVLGKHMRKPSVCNVLTYRIHVGGCVEFVELNFGVAWVSVMIFPSASLGWKLQTYHDLPMSWGEGFSDGQEQPALQTARGLINFVKPGTIRWDPRFFFGLLARSHRDN